jgi:hypothetical protein
MQLLIAIDKVNIIPIDSNDGKGTKKIIMFFVMIPIYFLISVVIKKKDLEDLGERYRYKWDRVFDSNVWLIVYIILSVALTFILAFLKKPL